jgi:site-specific DNA-methyltransferase (adenine-specific)
MEINKIYNEDCLQVLRSMPDKSVDLIVTDPPYFMERGGQGHSKLARRIAKICNNDIADIRSGFDTAILDECWRVMKVPNMYFWCSKMQVPMYLDYFVNKKGCNFEILTWVKNNPPPIFKNHYLIDKEFCLYFRRGGYCQPITYECAKTIFNTPINKKEKDLWGHPTIKPVSILKTLIVNSSKEGDLILDPFIGSGSTAVACIETKRNYIGMEIDSKYYEICQRRIKTAEAESLTLF